MIGNEFFDVKFSDYASIEESKVIDNEEKERFKISRLPDGGMELRQYTDGPSRLAGNLIELNANRKVIGEVYYGSAVHRLFPQYPWYACVTPNTLPFAFTPREPSKALAKFLDAVDRQFPNESPGQPQEIWLAKRQKRSRSAAPAGAA